MAPLEQRICRQRNHEAPDSGIPKRKKTETRPRLSCKIEYWLRSNHSDKSIASEYFTGDHLSTSALLEERPREKHACGSGDQSPNENLFAGKTSFNVKEMPQYSGDQYRSEENAEKVSYPNLGRVHD
jgi:hypothetical protein